MKKTTTFLTCLLLASPLASPFASPLASPLAGQEPPDDTLAEDAALDSVAVSRVLDDLHRAAHAGDFEGYFALYADDAVFLGTDPEERWPIEEFRTFARPHFEDGHGWTYHPIERHVRIGPEGRVAWFDERLDNASLGETRGTGALVRGEDGRWRVAQYNLTIPVPNALASEVVERIRSMDGEGGEDAPEGGSPEG